MTERVVQINQTDRVVVSTPSTRVVVLGGQQGPAGAQGPQGPAGGEVPEYVAGEALGGHRAVTLLSGEAVYASNTTALHLGRVIGITLGAAVQGDTVQVQPSGTLIEPSWNWNTALPVYLSTNGQLTQTTPTAGFSLILGFPLTATSLYVDIREPINLI